MVKDPVGFRVGALMEDGAQALDQRSKCARPRHGDQRGPQGQGKIIDQASDLRRDGRI
jgi:hypothetical protein